MLTIHVVVCYCMCLAVYILPCPIYKVVHDYSLFMYSWLHLTRKF